jgi:hypothetical protein
MARKGQPSVQGVTLNNKVIHVQYLEAGIFLMSRPFLYFREILCTMEVASRV